MLDTDYNAPTAEALALGALKEFFMRANWRAWLASQGTLRVLSGAPSRMETVSVDNGYLARGVFEFRDFRGRVSLITSEFTLLRANGEIRYSCDCGQEAACCHLGQLMQSLTEASPQISARARAAIEQWADGVDCSLGNATSSAGAPAAPEAQLVLSVRVVEVGQPMVSIKTGLLPPGRQIAGGRGVEQFIMSGATLKPPPPEKLAGIVREDIAVLASMGTGNILGSSGTSTEGAFKRLVTHSRLLGSIGDATPVEMSIGNPRPLKQRWHVDLLGAVTLVDHVGPGTDLFKVGGRWFIDPGLKEMGEVYEESLVIEAIDALVPVCETHIQLRNDPDLGVWIHVSFDYDGTAAPITDIWPGGTLSTDLGTKRNLTRERQVMVELLRQGFSFADTMDVDGLPWGAMIPKNPKARKPLDLLRTVPALRKLGFIIDVDEGFPVKLADSPERWTAHGEDAGGKWMSVTVGVEIAGRSYNLLPIIRKALSQGLINLEDETKQEDVVLQVDQTTCLSVPAARIRSFVAPLVEWLSRSTSDSALMVRKMEGGLLAKQIETSAVWTPATGLADQMVELQRTSEPVVVPPTFQGELKRHQQEGVEWLTWIAKSNVGAILADQQRMGKTVMTLAHMAIERAAGRLNGPTLVAARTTLVGNWKKKIQAFLPGWKVLTVRDGLDDLPAEYLMSFDVVIISWRLLHDLMEWFLAVKWALCVRDEVQDVKNWKTHAAVDLKRLHANRHLSLSATPWENNLSELWTQLDSVETGILGSHASFVTNFRNPIEKNGDTLALARLQARIKPFVLRRLRRDYKDSAADPEPIKDVVDMEATQRDLYESIKMAELAVVREVIQRRGGIRHAQRQILASITIMRRMCADPRLVIRHVPAAAQVKRSAKLERLARHCDEMVAAGKRALIFSQWTDMLDIIETDVMLARGYSYLKLTGGTSPAMRDKIQEDFQDGVGSFCLISLKAGGAGLDFYEADAAIIYDQWWNPTTEDQAADRIVSLDCTEAKWRYQIIMRDSVEERVEELKQRKGALMDAVWNGGAVTGMRFTEEDVRNIFGAI